MKNILLVFSLIIVALGFTSCDDEIKAVLKSDVAANELQTPGSDSYVLTMDDKANIMETFEWTATDFGYKAAVAYTIQIDLAGNDFANAIDVLTTNSLDAPINVGAFNDLLLALGIPPEEAMDIEIRVVSSVGTNVPLIYSSVKTVEVTSYATSFPPIYGYGEALKGWGAWDPKNAVEFQSSEYKKFETVTYFLNGKAFRFFAQQDYNPTSYNYPFFTTVDPIFENASDGDSNFKVAGPSGWYKVNVDLAAKTVTAVAVDEPVLYMTGAALNGWNWDPGNPVKMTFIKPGVFEATTSFNVTGETFRFFQQADWGPSYNYPYFTSVDANFENAHDDDSNFRFLGTPGSQKITVDLNAKTVTLGTPPDPVLYITGDDFGWDWVEGKYKQMTYKGSNTFELTATLTNGALFRFFPDTGWSPSYNYSYFTTVDAELANQGVGTDENFRYTGTTGSRKITVNMTTKVVSID